MERGKLEMELQEERKSRDQWIREQRMKIENSCTTKSFSDCGTNDNQVHHLSEIIIRSLVNLNLHEIFCSTDILCCFIGFTFPILPDIFLTIFSIRDRDVLGADLWKSTVTLVVVYLKEIFSNLLR